MAELIGDGYDWQGCVGEVRFSYRPMLEMERRAVIDTLRWVSHPEEFAQATILKHIIAGVSDQELQNMSDEQATSLWLIITGVSGSRQWFNQWEALTARNLREGVRLWRQSPTLARRSCEDCKKWWYGEDGKIATEGGKKLERPKEYQLACETSLGCPVGHFEKQKRLSPINKLAYLHYQNCKSIEQFPEDPIVARNARIIAEAESRK